MTMPHGTLPRVTARLATLTGAIGSVALTIVAGHRNPSVLLLAIFAGWVLLPFAALVVADLASSRWAAPGPITRAVMALLVTATSFGVYGTVAFAVPRVKAGFPFLVLPPVLVLFVAVVWGAAIKRSPRRPRS
jgi:hypothetical protein